jgi:hypothetical protein
MTTTDRPAGQLADRLREPDFGAISQAEHWIASALFHLDHDMLVDPATTAARTVTDLRRAMDRLQWAIEHVETWGARETERQAVPS